MRNYDYGVASPIEPTQRYFRNDPNNRRMRTSISLTRPKSQPHRMTFQGQPHARPLGLSPRAEEQQQSRKSFQVNVNVSGNSSGLIAGNGFHSNQYYLQSSVNSKTAHQIGTSGVNQFKLQEGGGEKEKLEKWRKSMSVKIEKMVRELRETICEQSGQIMELERVIQRLERELDAKNGIIEGMLHHSLATTNNCNSNNKSSKEIKIRVSSPNSKKTINEPVISQSFLSKKFSDLQTRLRLLSTQQQEQHSHLLERVDDLTSKTINFLGEKMVRNRQLLFFFLVNKEKHIERLDQMISALMDGTTSDKVIRGEEKVYCMVENVPPTIHANRNNVLSPSQSSHRHDLKNSTEGMVSIKDTCSSVNTKESMNLQKPSKKRKDQSLFSDYFFIPTSSTHSQGGTKDSTIGNNNSGSGIIPNSNSKPGLTDQEISPQKLSTSTTRAMEQLIKDREQLPIRVFIDGSGRLKYWESRTFIFDRKGNFSIPGTEELAFMEWKGWIRVVEK